ncbi:MraY family glycosyltransferase [Allostella humosa]|uniref:MraY family glycosyltransferase n=1 Tax=Stella humosa TaxID=94 RepID=UPI001FEC23AA|nr:glycosyltransferase family 4 protein [Stella humosa]
MIPAVPPYLVALAALVGLLAWLATGRVTRWLGQRAILDQPNDRSSHQVPTPRGGGLGLLPPVLGGWCLLAFLLDGPAMAWAMATGALLLMAVSWRDDRGGLPVRLRLLVQLVAVVPVVSLLPAPIAQGWLPGWLDMALAAVAWVWFVNLYNFMDGIDGISGVETMALGCGLALVALATGPADAAGYGLVLAAGAAGFLAWNWHPARVFLGDVGSVPLGYLAGGLLLALAASGQWAAALILPLYYLADATLTLLRRALRAEKVWQAHRQHFYQRATQAGLSHAAVALRVGACDVLLVACALWSLAAPWPALAVASAIVAALLVELGRRR